MVVVMFAAISWEGAIGAIPYGVQYGGISLVGCLAAIWIKEESGKAKENATIRTSYRKFGLAIIFGTGLTWIATNFLHASVDICYVIAGVVGLCIEPLAPWVQRDAFERIKKYLKSE